MVEDPFIRHDFVENAIEVIFRKDDKNITPQYKTHLYRRDLHAKTGRQLVSEIMNWVSTIYDDLLSKYDDNMQDVLNALALVSMGNVCLLNDDTIDIIDNDTVFKVVLEDNVRQFLKQELVHLTARMHFDVPNMLLIGLETSEMVVSMSVEQLIIQDILYNVPLRAGRYRFVSNLLRDFLIEASICYKTLPAVQRDVKTTLLQYFHKFKYLHIPVCNPVTYQAALSHNQVVINVYKEVEKNNPAMADEFAYTLLCALEFCNRPEAKGWLEYFGSKLKLVHSEGTFRRNGGVLSKATKQLLTSLVTHNILYKFIIADANVGVDTKTLIKSKLEEFIQQRHFTFTGEAVFMDKSASDAIVIIRAIQILDLLNCSSHVELSEDGRLVCELEKNSPVLENGISVDLSHNILNSKLSQNIQSCFASLHCLTSLSLVRMTNLDLQWLRSVFIGGLLSDLRTIDLSENREFENLDREIGLKFCPDLTHLSIAKCALGDKGFDILSKEIQILPKLRHLNVSGNDTTPHGLISLTMSLMEKNTMTNINLADSSLGGGCASGVLSLLLKSVPMLEELNLSNNALDDNDIALIIKSMPSTIKMLHLGGNNLSLVSTVLKEFQIQMPNLKIMGYD